MTEAELIEAKRAFHESFRTVHQAGSLVRKMRPIEHCTGITVLRELPCGGWSWSITESGVGRVDSAFRFFSEGEAVDHLADHLLAKFGPGALADKTRWRSRCRGGQCGVRLSREAKPCASS